jgi:hypothetical protein
MINCDDWIQSEEDSELLIYEEYVRYVEQINQEDWEDWVNSRGWTD